MTYTDKVEEEIKRRGELSPHLGERGSVNEVNKYINVLSQNSKKHRNIHHVGSNIKTD